MTLVQIAIQIRTVIQIQTVILVQTATQIQTVTLVQTATQIQTVTLVQIAIQIRTAILTQAVTQVPDMITHLITDTIIRLMVVVMAIHIRVVDILAPIVITTATQMDTGLGITILLMEMIIVVQVVIIMATRMIIHIKVVHITHLIQIITGNLRVTIRKVAHQMQIIMLAMAIILRQYILRIVMMEFY